jgi:glycosyltransferase involved in cell wall biosynthesis
VISYFYLMPVSSETIRVAFSVTNCICNDQRVMKMADTVERLGCEITIIGRKSGECCKSEKVPFTTKRFSMIFRRSFFFYAFFNIRLFLYLLFHDFDLLVANDLDTLLPNYLASRIKRCPLIYDSHEYFTGVPEIQNRHFVKWVWKSIEKLLFPRLKNVITVSDSIADLYHAEYHIKPIVVRNCSPQTGEVVPFSRRELGISENNLLLIFQGTGINTDRGGEELIDAINITPDVSLLIVGAGDSLEIIRTKVIRLNLQDRIKFIPKCKWETLMRYTATADAGLSLDKNTNINYLYSLPNKLFDYISAGIPVIATNLAELSKIINEFRCGILIPIPSPEEISKAICTLRDNKRLLSELKQNSVIASESMNWDKESGKVEDLYRSIINNL